MPIFLKVNMLYMSKIAMWREILKSVEKEEAVFE
jgi:hypothetical protein